MILHSEMTTCRAGRPRNIMMWTKGQGGNIREEEDENNGQLSNNEIQRGGGCSLSVLNQGKKGQEDKCPSSTGTVENEIKKSGERE
jgi:hypothetical protein